MLPRCVFLLTIASFVSPVVQAAEVLGGSQLRQLCNGSRGSIEDVACFTYIQGFVEGAETHEVSKPKDRKPWCLPDEATVSQARLVVEKYMQDNSATLDQSAASIVRSALQRAFPCQTTR